MMQLTQKVVSRLHTELQAPDLTGTRYRLVRFLARGGMGGVWLAEDTVLQRRVALKVLDLVADGYDLSARLLQEARTLAALEHPGIVPAHDAGTLADGRAFYCMKYVEGQTLAQHIASKTLSEKLRLMERIAEPIDFAHARGFIHRDLKPENIMIGAFGEVLVMDWGLARVNSTASKSSQVETASVIEIAPSPADIKGMGSVSGSLLGTPGYISPEQARGGHRVDHRTDIYSLGAVLLFMLTESTPGNSPAACTGGPKPLWAICAKAMADDPGQRYQSARELTADIRHFLDGVPVSAYREGLLERAGRIYTRNNIAVVLIAAYLLMRLLFILFARG